MDEHHLEKSYAFDDFKQALDFTNRVGAIAESEGHHPDVHLAWGRVTLTIWTHKIDGLTESDFILAARPTTPTAHDVQRRVRRPLSVRSTRPASSTTRASSIISTRRSRSGSAGRSALSYPDLVIKERIGFPSVRVETEFLKPAALR